METGINLPTGLGVWRSQHPAPAGSPSGRRPSLRKGWLPAAWVWPPLGFCYLHWGLRSCYRWRNQIQPCPLHPSPPPPPSPTAHRVPHPGERTAEPGALPHGVPASRVLVTATRRRPFGDTLRFSRTSCPWTLTPPAPAISGLQGALIKPARASFFLPFLSARHLRTHQM